MEEMCARCLIFVLNDIFIFSGCLSLGIVYCQFKCGAFYRGVII